REERVLVGELDHSLRADGVPRALVHRVDGRTSLGGMAAIVGGSRLLLANDTGVSHIAAGLRHPSVIVASGSDVRRWATLDAGRQRGVWSYALSMQCAFDNCPHGNACACDVSTAAVLAAIDEQLERHAHDAH